jgi:hypothetical protein
MALRRLGPCNVGHTQPADHRQANSAGEDGMRVWPKTIGSSDSVNQNLRDCMDKFVTYNRSLLTARN